VKITLEITSRAWQDMKTAHIKWLREGRCGIGRDHEMLTIYDRLIARAEGDNPDRAELAMWLGGLAGINGFSSGLTPMADGWDEKAE
jgi:hypothetical protein